MKHIKVGNRVGCGAQCGSCMLAIHCASRAHRLVHAGQWRACTSVSLCALDAQYVLVAAPEQHIDFHLFALLGSRVSLVGSYIGSTAEIAAMLDFAGKHDVRPLVEVLPVSAVNEGIRKVRENDVAFELCWRVVSERSDCLTPIV